MTILKDNLDGLFSKIPNNIKNSYNRYETAINVTVGGILIITNKITSE